MTDIFTLFTNSDIRQTRDNFRSNLETFILAVSSRLFYLFNHSQFPHPEIAPAKELLNCVRLLTRVLPFIFEQKNQSSELDQWSHSFFWERRRIRKDSASHNNNYKYNYNNSVLNSSASTTQNPVVDNDEYDQQRNTSEFYELKPLGEQLIDTAFNLLFFSDFTIPKPANSSSKVSYSIWDTGVGCTTSLNSTNEQDSNKIEILRFLLALTSGCLYTSPSTLPVEGSPFLTYMVTKTDKRMAMAILCSLLNTTLQYSPKWNVPYDHMLVSDNHKLLITYSIQYLETLLIYPIPESEYFTDGSAPKNIFRHLCSKIHKLDDLQFISDSLAKMLSQPINASSSYLPGSRKEIPWSMELAMLFWDLVQCNKRFKQFLIGTERMHDFFVIMLYFISDKACDEYKLNFVRLCTYELLYLTSDPSFASSLSKTFNGHGVLPGTFQLPPFNGSYADYFIIKLIKTITNKHTNLNILVPTFLNCINNIAPYTINICYQAAASLVQLCAAIANPSFLFANESNHNHLESVLKSMNLMIECHFASNRNLVFLILKNESVFNTIRSLTVGADVESIWSSVSKKSIDAKISSSYAELEQSVSAFVIDDGDKDDEDDSDDNRKDDEKELIKKTTTLSIEEEEKKRNPELNVFSSNSSGSTLLKNKGKGTPSRHMRQDSLISEKGDNRGYYSPETPATPTSNSMSQSSIPYDSKGAFHPTTEWTLTWLPLLPIYTITTMISHLKKCIPYFRDQSSQNQTLTAKLDASKAIDSISTVTSIPGIVFYGTVNSPQQFPSDFSVEKFTWNRGSLGWYESILWGCIYQAERGTSQLDAANMIMHNSTSNSVPVGVWNNTNIKLFRVQQTAPKGPSLLRPRGAVDAVADTMIQKIGQFRHSKN